ncbi:MAG: ribonuclease H-like domain-containing protein [Deltaproteobacteria bacterium]|nr:ribonuclease H-like domain-containing protein [Deltaproteobacteria bacterium]MBW2659258.1 ribonuclease H-like domain-containing protein [Deltaproteobacteria bacterium]
MLNHTFCHIDGVGLKTEKKLWQAGITTWDKWRSPAPVKLSGSLRAEITKTLGSSLHALHSEPHFFSKRLSGSELWRIFPHYRNETVYLDIETTGLDDFAEITTIALYDGKKVFTYVNGENLDDFIEDIFNYKVIVSYNGKSFDIPFLERYFRTKLPHAQIDLRYVLAGLGFKGGLKGCEKQLGINRGDLDGVDGYFAVLLWREYQKSGNRKLLETLLAYNIDDTVNLERLAVEAYNKNVLNTPFGSELLLPLPQPPPLPFSADPACIDKIRGHSDRSW